jgi:thioredoxin reductase
VSHTSGYRSFDAFKGQKVVVIGRGQSALESAAILHESGAQVEILTRGKMIHFINREERRDLLGRIAAIPEINHFLYPPTDLAGPPHNWAIADPVIYRQLSKEKQALLFRLVGPMGSTDLETRLAEVPITTRVEVLRALALGDGVNLSLSDGSRRMVDHVFLATGFRPNINYCGFLSKDLTAAIAQEEGYPLLTLGYESTTVKGLYVLGALACKSLGPINRFVCGTYLVGQYLTEAVTGSRLGYPHGVAQRYVTGRRLAYRLYQVSGISDMLALRRQKVPTT